MRERADMLACHFALVYNVPHPVASPIFQRAYSIFA